jgi:hypothetical protein
MEVALPREHGAYAQALLPLITGASLGPPTLVSLLLVAAVVFAFLAHEPLLVALGRRGARALERRERIVRRRVTLLLGAAVSSGVGALVLGDAAVRIATLPPLALGLVYAGLALGRREKSLLRDLLVAFAFSAMVVPIGLAVGGSLAAATVGASVWLVTFGLQTIAVKGTIAAGKKRARSLTLIRLTTVLSVLVIVAAVALALTTVRPGTASLAVLPAGLHALVLAVRPVPSKHLRRVGWSLLLVDVMVLGALGAWLLAL